MQTTWDARSPRDSVCRGATGGNPWRRRDFPFMEFRSIEHAPSAALTARTGNVIPAVYGGCNWIDTGTRALVQQPERRGRGVDLFRSVSIGLAESAWHEV